MSETPSGSIAAARAYLAAGNFKLAEVHLAPILAVNPVDHEACWIWCDLLSTQRKFEELETFARAWIGRDVRNPAAYQHLFRGFIARSDRPNATAILAEFCRLFPSRLSDQKLMRDVLEATCPNRASSFDGMIAQFEASGDEKTALFLQSKAAFCRRDFAEAIRLGDLSWAAGLTDTRFAIHMAMTCFRTFRLAKSRRYARLALRAEPGHAEATELLVLTWLVWFPPLLLGHACFILTDSRREFRTAFWCLGIAMASFFATLLMDSLSAFALSISYLLYAPHIGSIASIVSRRRVGPIRLSRY